MSIVESRKRWPNGLLDKPIRIGTSFRKPSAKTVRIEQAEIGPRDLTAEEIRKLLESANVPMKAMILLGTNCGLGNNDVARLLKPNVDLKAGWLVFPRPKTGVPRRAKLWPEMIDAIELVLKKRPEPKDPDDADYVFVTKMKSSWAKETAGNNPVSLMFKKLLKEEELYRPGIGIYSLRRTFETVAGETLDQPAVDLVTESNVSSRSLASKSIRSATTFQGLFQSKRDHAEGVGDFLFRIRHGVASSMAGSRSGLAVETEMPAFSFRES